MKKLIFQYKRTENEKTKTNIELWFYPIRTAVIIGISIVGYIAWKVLQ